MSKDTHGDETDSTSTAEQSPESANPDARAQSPVDAAAAGEPGTSASAPDTATTPSLTKSVAADADITDATDGETDADSAAASASTEPQPGVPAAEAGPEPGRSPALIATAVALPIALLVGILVMAFIARQNVTRDPVALGSVPAPGATGPACTALLPELPAALGDYTNAELAQPAPAATKAWQLPEGGDPIVLRCGLDRPLEFNRASPLQVVNGVNWFAVRDETSGATSGTYFAVDRGTYIAVTMADSAGPTPLQEVSDAITKTIPAQPLDPGPLPS